LHNPRPLFGQAATNQAQDAKADYTLKIATTPLEQWNGRRISGSRDRLHCEQPWRDLVTLPSATAHGLRLHGVVRIRVTDRYQEGP
jgi:hypothetical protein